MLVWI